MDMDGHNNKLLWKKIYSNNIYAYNNLFARNINCISDYRLQNDIKTLNNIYTVQNLNPISFVNKNTNKEDIGLIAHELQEQYPELVYGIKDGVEHQSINYIGLICILINDFKNMKSELTSIKRELSEIKKNTNLQL
jgi:hypothetical protein